MVVPASALPYEDGTTNSEYDLFSLLQMTQENDQPHEAEAEGIAAAQLPSSGEENQPATEAESQPNMDVMHTEDTTPFQPEASDGGRLWQDTNWADDGHHPDDETFGSQVAYGKGTGRPDGGWSKTLEPHPVGVPRTTDVGVKSVTLGWNIPKENGAVIEGYRVYMREGDDGKWMFKADAHSESEISMIIDQLKGNTLYEFKVAPLFDHFKQGPESNVTNVITKAGKPDPPGKPFVSDIGLKSMKVHWTAPESNGEVITGYRVTMLDDAVESGEESFVEMIANTDSNETSAVVTGLQPGGHVYQFRVNAINSVGTSLHSVSSATYQTLYPSAPAAPVNLTSTALDASAIRLTWEPPITDNGEPVTGYRVMMQREGQGPYEVVYANTGYDVDHEKSLNPTTYDVEKLRAGKHYTFSVQAINTRGVGLKVFSQEIGPLDGAPEAPDKPAVGHVSIRSCHIEWKEPWNGGKPISGYRISMRRAHMGEFVEKIENTQSTETSAKITGLEEGGLEYEFKVQAINSLGIGAASEASSSITTLFSPAIAVAKAVQQAVDDFKAHEPIHELWQLQTENERSSKQIETQKRQVKVAEEDANTAKNEAAQLAVKLQLEMDLANQKLSVEKSVGDDKVDVQKNMWMKKRELIVDKYDKIISEAQEKSDLKIAEVRSVAKSQVKKVESEAAAVCDAKQAKTKEQTDAVAAKEAADRLQEETRLKTEIERIKDGLALEIGKQRKAMQVKLAQITEDMEKRFTKESDELRNQIAKMNKSKVDAALFDSKKKEKNEIITLEKSRINVVEAARETQRRTEEDLATAHRELEEKEKKAVSAAEVVKARKEELGVAKAKEKAAEESYKKLSDAFNESQSVQLGQSLTWHAVVVDLGEGLDAEAKMSEAQRRDLIEKMEDARNYLKTVQIEVELNTKRLVEAEQMSSELQADIAQGKVVTAQLKVKATEDSKVVAAKIEAAQLIAEQIQVRKENIAKEEARELKKAQFALQRKIPLSKPVWGLQCTGINFTAADFVETLPDDSRGLVKEMANRKNSASSIMMGEDAAAKFTFLNSCEMKANCLAMGGNGTDIATQNCNPDTMCSIGSTRGNARPCATCATFFLVQRWRAVNDWSLKRCDGSVSFCQPTPLHWKLCSEEDTARNPDGPCPENVIDRLPAPVDTYNVGQDVSVAHTHCTSCMEGDALEIIHPETKTGKCKSFGPSDGSANLNRMPACYALDDMIVRPDEPAQVCSTINRPSVLYSGNNSDTFLVNHTNYAFVTCNLRHMSVCAPEDNALAGPQPMKLASYAHGASGRKMMKCTTEKQISCANVCRISKHGYLCPKGDETCDYGVITPENARVIAQSELFSKSFPLGEYDCDPGRCQSHFCNQLALS